MPSAQVSGSDLLPLLTPLLNPGASVAAGSPALAGALATAGFAPAAVTDASIDAVLLLDDELSVAGDAAEATIAEAVGACRPGGLVAVTARNAVHAAATGIALDGLRGFSADQLAHALTHAGAALALTCAPGAAATLAGRAWNGVADLELDTTPGLLDAAPRTLVAATTARNPHERSHRFFAQAARKLVAAAVICRDSQGRLLVVHDSFKGHWTIPGGLVDAGEDPQTAAVREAYEEAGVRVVAGELLAIFSGGWIDRLLLVYAATPIGDQPHPQPVHPHEVDAVAWLPLDEALARLGPDPRYQVQTALASPGGTWRG